MPMAGRGERMKPLTDCKVLLPVGPENTPLFILATQKLGFSFDKIVYVARAEHQIKQITDRWLSHSIERKIIEVSDDAMGPLDSALRARAEFENSDDELVIVNSDQVMDWPGNWAMDWFKRRGAVGGIPTVERNSPRHSYVELDPKMPHKVIRAREKEVISNRATVGIYWFASGRQFAQAADKCMAESPGTVVKEYYVAPIYNFLNGLILEFPLCEFWSIGEPKNLALYLNGTRQSLENDC